MEKAGKLWERLKNKSVGEEAKLEHSWRKIEHRYKSALISAHESLLGAEEELAKYTSVESYDIQSIIKTKIKIKQFKEVIEELKELYKEEFEKEL